MARSKEVRQGVKASFKGRLDTHKIHSREQLFHFRLRFKSDSPCGSWKYSDNYRVRVVPIGDHYYFLCEPVQVSKTGRKPKGVYSVQSEKDGKWYAMQISPGVYSQHFRMFAGTVRPSGKQSSVVAVVDLMGDGSLRVQRPDIVRTPDNADVPPGQSLLDANRKRKPKSRALAVLPEAKGAFALMPREASTSVPVEDYVDEVPAPIPQGLPSLVTRITHPGGATTELYNDGTKVEHFPDPKETKDADD